jgi:hypothetical protein
MKGIKKGFGSGESIRLDHVPHPLGTEMLLHECIAALDHFFQAALTNYLLERRGEEGAGVELVLIPAPTYAEAGELVTNQVCVTDVDLSAIVKIRGFDPHSCAPTHWMSWSILSAFLISTEFLLI